MVDPRRPLKNDATVDREEGVIPYDALLAISPKSFINYYKKVPTLTLVVVTIANQVYNVQGIYTAPVYLESTSLVIAFGLDVFCTRVTPSNTFDILNTDFNYFALLATSVTLLILTVVSMWIAKKRDISRTWK